MAKYNLHYSILSALKRVFSRSPYAREARENAKCPRKKGPRGGARYKCASCKKDFGITEIQVDHINPVIPIGTPSREMTWDEIVANLFCRSCDLQVVCIKCHKIKSKEENALRKKVKDERKDK